MRIHTWVQRTSIAAVLCLGTGCISEDGNGAAIQRPSDQAFDGGTSRGADTIEFTHAFTSIELRGSTEEAVTAVLDISPSIATQPYSDNDSSATTFAFAAAMDGTQLAVDTGDDVSSVVADATLTLTDTVGNVLTQVITVTFSP